jgi:hypothetical protein
VVVRAGRTRGIILDHQLDGSTGAVLVTSDQPVVTEGLALVQAKPHRPDLMWLAATDSLSGPAAVATGREPDGGSASLLLTAPAAAAVVTVRTPGGHTQTITVPAGHSVASNITNTIRTTGGSWSFVASVTSGGPVYGVRLLSFSGAHGALVTGEPLVALPKPISLPPVREDPRAGVR